MFDPEEDGSNDAFVHHWVWTRQEALECELDEVECLAFSPGGTHLLAGGKDGLELWNLELKEKLWLCVGPLACPGGAKQIAFSPDGRLIASRGATGMRTIRIWWHSESAQHGGFAHRLLPHDAPVESFEFRGRSGATRGGFSGQTLMTMCQDGRIRIWQESDVLEDFDFFCVGELAMGGFSFSSWIHDVVEYEGLLWEPSRSFRKRKSASGENASSALSPPLQSRKTTSAITPTTANIPFKKPLSSRRVWGGMERGHGHVRTSGGDILMDNAECRLGTFPPRCASRDWIVALGTSGCIQIWQIEGLGEEKSRSSVRISKWEDVEFPLAPLGLIQTLFAFQRLIVPACMDGGRMPSCDQLHADNPPFRMTMMMYSKQSGCSVLLLNLDRSRRLSDEESRVRLLCGGPNTGHANSMRVLDSKDDLFLTVSKDDQRVLVWESHCTVKQCFQVPESCQVVFGCFYEDSVVCLIRSDNSERFGIVKFTPGQNSLGGPEPEPPTWLQTNENLREALFFTCLRGDSEEKCTFTLLFRDFILVGDVTQSSFVVEPLIRGATCAVRSGDDTVLWIGNCDGSLCRFPRESHEKNSAVVHVSHATAQKAYCARISSSGPWICRLLKSNSLENEELCHAMVSFAPTLNVNDASDCEIVEARVLGLPVSAKIIDLVLTELSPESGVFALAIVCSDGSTYVASRRAIELFDWHVVASYEQGLLLNMPQDSRAVAWSGSHVLIFDNLGIAYEFSPWTSLVRLSGAQVALKPSQRRALLQMQNADVLGGSTTGDALSFDESTGHLTRLCLISQTALPAYHPRNLLEHMRLGRFECVEKALKELVVEDDAVTAPPPTKPSNDIFDSFAMPSSSSFSLDWISTLETKLPMLKFPKLTRSEHLGLLSCVGLYRKFRDEKISGLDAAGSKFALAVETMKLLRATGDTSASLHTYDVAWALHSDAQSVLIQNFLNTEKTTWEDCRELGAGFWVQNTQDAKALMERLAKNQYTLSNRDPFRCLLFYCASGKPRVMSALFKVARNERVAIMLAQDFGQERWQSAAVKNAFALMDKRRFEEASAFFLLGGRINEALRVLTKNLEDYQLAMFVARVLKTNGLPYVMGDILVGQNMMWDDCLAVAKAARDPWFCSMIFSQRGEAEKAVRCFRDDFFAIEASLLATMDNHDVERERERKEWLRHVAERLRPKCSGFDPVVGLFLKRLLAKAPFFWGTQVGEENVQQTNEFRDVLRLNDLRSISYFCETGLPALALALSEKNGAEVGDKFLQGAKIRMLWPVLGFESSVVGGVRVGGGISKGTSAQAHSRSVEICIDFALVRYPFARLACSSSEEDDTDQLGAHVVKFLELDVCSAITEIASGGRHLRVGPRSGRRLLCYALILRENTNRVGKDLKDIVQTSAFACAMVACMLLNQIHLCNALSKSSTEFDDDVASELAKLSQDVLDFEETFGSAILLKSAAMPVARVIVATTPWAQSYCRAISKLAALRDARARVVNATLSLKTIPGFVRSVELLVERLRFDLHGALGLPGMSPFSSFSNTSNWVDPFRPFFAQSRSFEDLDEQALWSTYNGSERVTDLINEIGCASRFRKRQWETAITVNVSVPAAAAAAARQGSIPDDQAKKTSSLNSICLYQYPNDVLHGVAVSSSFHEHVMVCSDRGSREINIASSLKYRLRTPDGRGLIDAEKDTWVDVMGRFAGLEAKESLNSSGDLVDWEYLVSAPGMKRQRYLASQQQPAAVATAAAFAAAGLLAKNKNNSLASNSWTSTSTAHYAATRVGAFRSFAVDRFCKEWNARHDDSDSTVLPGHDQPVFRLSGHPFLPGYAAGCDDGSVLYYRAGYAKAECRFTRLHPLVYGMRSMVTGISRIRFSPSGYHLIVADSHARCAMWHLEDATNPVFDTFCALKSVTDCAFLDRSTCFATTSSDGMVSIFDTLLPAKSSRVASWMPPTSGEPLPSAMNTMNHTRANNPHDVVGLSSIACGARGSSNLYVGSSSGSIFTVDLRQMRTLIHGKNAHASGKPITALEISPDRESYLASCSLDGSIRLFSLTDLNPVASCVNLCPGGVTDLSFSENGSLFSCGANGAVHVSYVASTNEIF